MKWRNPSMHLCSRKEKYATMRLNTNTISHLKTQLISQPSCYRTTFERTSFKARVRPQSQITSLDFDADFIDNSDIVVDVASVHDLSLV